MFEAGTIVLVPYPFTDQSHNKRRPVLALTGPDQRGDFIGCPMTSRDRWINSRTVLSTDMTEGALPMATWVRTDRVVTLNADLVVARIGLTVEGFRRAVANDLCRFIQGVPEPASA